MLVYSENLATARDVGQLDVNLMVALTVPATLGVPAMAFAEDAAVAAVVENCSVAA